LGRVFLAEAGYRRALGFALAGLDYLKNLNDRVIFANYFVVKTVLNFLLNAASKSIARAHINLSGLELPQPVFMVDFCEQTSPTMAKFPFRIPNIIRPFYQENHFIWRSFHCLLYEHFLHVFWRPFNVHIKGLFAFIGNQPQPIFL
jgi:hypothetical protein